MKKEFSLAIECENAAFGDDSLDAGREVARILRKLATALEAGMFPDSEGTLTDENGNRVGAWGYRDDSAD